MTDIVADDVIHFREAVSRTVPPESTVVVVSRGDDQLLRLDDREGWHFPQRPDGVYLGYYPPDSAAAIEHLESLRERGAEFLAFPATALWWLDHYTEFAEHLERAYRCLRREPGSGAIYVLDPDREIAPAEAAEPEPAPAPEPEREPTPPAVEDRLLDAARAIFDAEHYARQAGREFPSADAAFAHYLEAGHRSGLNPHILFDGAWYSQRHPEAQAAGESPLLHFLRQAPGGGHDPNPYFDADYYYGQRPALAESGVNALFHYLEQGSTGEVSRPNPLFHDAYYRQTYNDVADSGITPLEHYLRHGAADRRYVSHIHRNIFDRLRESSVTGLLRGNWRRGAVLAFTRGGTEPALLDAAETERTLAREHRLDLIHVTFRRAPGGDGDGGGPARTLVLEDYELACAIFRPSALRMLARTLATLRPVLALTEVPDVLWPLRDAGVGGYAVDGDAATPEPGGVGALLDRSVADFGLDRMLAQPEPARRGGAPSKVIVVCSDWTVSGVNAALEAVGQELIRKGWDLEIVFTRAPEFVLASAKGEAHMPALPYRFLERLRPGLDGMWESLVADLQRRRPCIAFLAYDQVANAVVPALTDEVGVVSWVQADDGDYYEQAYRLGRYCNAIVCVSSHIRDKVVELNPALAPRTHVIHNTSVGAAEVASRRAPYPDRLRLVYTGRLVQYQKRVLDYVELARALDRAGVPYELSLIGDFTARDGTQALFEQRGAEHLRDGRIRLLGRLPRDRILEELTANAAFVLLSDFEGLPLSLVEAMARGCVPIVAESPSGIPEIVASGRNGLIVRGRDYDEWARLLSELWGDPTRLAAMSRSARATVRDAFTIERIGHQFDVLLRGIADEVGGERYERPPALTWGTGRAPAGDVLPPPNLFLAAPFARYPGLP